MSVEILQIIVYGEKLEGKETKETRRGQKKKSVICIFGVQM